MKNKKSFLIIIAVIIVGILGVTFNAYVSNKVDPDAKVIAEVRDARLGSAVRVTLTEKGTKAYENAKKYQVIYEGKPVSAIRELGVITTVFPERKAKEKVVIKIFTEKEEVIDSIDVKLIKFKKE